MNEKTNKCPFGISPIFAEEKQTKIQREEFDGCIKEGCMWYNKFADQCNISIYNNIRRLMH